MARQKLGQHFLASEKALRRIVEALDPQEGERAVEIGPGKGALTEQLLKRFAHVTALELDSELAEGLRSRWSDSDRLNVVEGNALGADWESFGAGVLAGNLPYYVASALISGYLKRPGALRHAVFLIQKEVAERITASPGTRDYGYLSVECQSLARAEYLFQVPPGAFRPPPRVDSAVIRLTPLERTVDPAGFLEFVSVCFRQKRKTLRNNLSALFDLEGVTGLERRAEQLTIAEFRQLSDELNRRARNPR